MEEAWTEGGKWKSNQGQYMEEHVNLVKVIKMYPGGNREPRKVFKLMKEYILEGAR